MKKRTKSFLLGSAAALFLTGCGIHETDGVSFQKTAEGKQLVSIAFWSDQLTERYGQYLQETFPEVEFEFYVATNSTDFYKFKEKQGDLPDILTVRRFSLNDVVSWKDSLMDLSDSELANTFPQAYLRNYTYEDGTVNWLPACAEVDGLLVNKQVLEANHIPIPTNYQEFVETCGTLTSLGIRPFRSNFAADYTCMEILQGLSIHQLTSQEGREWRQCYESGQTDQLDEAVWMPVFERMLEFIEYTGLSASDLEGDTAAMFASYQNHETAMIRGTSSEASYYGVAEESVLMPYYDTSTAGNWYLTYPAFQIAASSDAEKDPERQELIFRIMEAMLSQKGLEHIATGQNMIAYNKDVTLPISDILSPLPACMENNHLYIRLASSDMFSVSREVVQGMLEGKYPDARSAFDAFNQAMGKKDKEDSAVIHISRDYPYTFVPEGGSQAASAVMNSLREELDTQILIGQSVNVAGNITAGDYTQAQLGFLTMGESVDILLCRMTGNQLNAYLDYILASREGRGRVINDSTLYVSSGFEMEIQKTDDGYFLERLTMEGKELDTARTYSAAILGNALLMQRDALAAAGVTEYESAQIPYRQLITDRLSKGQQLADPTDYITLLH